MSILTSRKAAVEAGELYYFRPCKYGHEGKRHINRATCMTCSAEASRNYKLKNSKKISDYKRKNQPIENQQAKQRRQSNREKSLWSSAKARAKAQNKPFNIEVSDVVIPDFCPVLGIRMTRPSLDRVDNSKGYRKDNIAVLSYEANRLKSYMSVEIVQKLLCYMKKEGDQTR